MAELFDSSRQFALHTIQHAHKWPSGKGGLLSLAHLGGRHHLHCLGNPRRIANRSDTVADVTGAMHDRYPEIKMPQSLPCLLESVGRGLQFLGYGGSERLFVSDFLKQVGFTRC